LISKHINTNPESLALSLEDWGKWIDDGGYGREDFAAILLQIVEAQLGVSAASTCGPMPEQLALLLEECLF
jgi:hypothetical protein